MKLYRVQKLKDTNEHRVVILSDGMKVDTVSGLDYDSAINVVTNLAANGDEYEWSIDEIVSFESADKQQAMLEIMLTTKGHDDPKIGTDYMDEGTMANADDILLDDKKKD